MSTSGEREPGQLLRTARDRIRDVAERAPPEFCRTEEDKAALTRLMLWSFPNVYAKKPVQRTMRIEGGGCEFRVRPADVQDDGRFHSMSFVSKTEFERTYFEGTETLVPGESFGMATVFCDASGTRLGSVAVVLPAGDGVHWPPPLTFVPGLDTLCNVLYHVVDGTPLGIFGGLAERKDRFREDVFRRIVPSVYQESTKAFRDAGRAFVLTIRADHEENFRLRVLDEDECRQDCAWVYDGAEPGESFPLVFNFEAGGASQFAMPCMEEWPASWVTEWLRERPPSDACRRCGTKEPKPKLCTSCRSVRYCSVSCQHADWRRHKKECVIMSGARRDS